MEIDQRRGRAARSRKRPDLQVLPAFAVAHRRVGDALEEMHAFDHQAEDVVRARRPAPSARACLQPQKQLVQLLPHVGADLLAHLPRVLAGGGHARQHRIGGSPASKISASTSAAGLVGATVGGLELDHRVQRREVPAVGVRLAIEPEIEADVDQPRGVLRAFEIAADPVERVGDARQQHRQPQSSSTQVSLLPPPCDELTTSDPLRSATRVRPPGTIVTRSP